MTDTSETGHQADPVAQAVATLELLSPEARERVLGRMAPEVADRIRTRLSSMPDDRPHGVFSEDVADRRRMLRELAERVHGRRTDVADRAARELDAAAAGDPGRSAPMGGMAADGVAAAPPMDGRYGSMQAPSSTAPPATMDPLAQLRVLHPAAVARAMQGERAEAWALVLDRMDSAAREALELYLDVAARQAIVDARRRQHDLRDQAPALLTTIESAIARTVVPRAMREHHFLLSTAPSPHYQPGIGA